MLTIKFVDGEIIQNVPWLSLPNKPIKRLKYIYNKTIILENYESYNHLIEKAYNVFQGNTITRAIYLFGKYNENVTCVKINLIDNTINEYTAIYTQEYNNRPSTGWKIGINDGGEFLKIF